MLRLFVFEIAQGVNLCELQSHALRAARYVRLLWLCNCDLGDRR
jgi:hypothetical protein